MILPAQAIPLTIVSPFVAQKTIHPKTGMSYGLSCAGYDIRLKQDMILFPFIGLRLGSSLEYFDVPSDILATVHDKSTLARLGIAAQATVIEPGWRGWLTLEITNHGPRLIRLVAGQPIAQVVFHRLEQPTARPYAGKYQDQPNKPVSAIKECR